MDYPEKTNTTSYGAVPPPKASFHPMIHGPATDLSSADHNDASMISKKKKNKRRGVAFLCCTNVEFDTEKGKDNEKALGLLENINNRRSLMMCCSNIEVGPKKDCDGVGSKKEISPSKVMFDGPP